MDPLAARLEPLLSARFANTRPVSVPRYQRYPLGDGKSNTLVDFVQNNPQLFQESSSSTPQPQQHDNNGLSKRRQSDGSFFHGSDNSLGSDPLAAQMTSRNAEFHFFFSFLFSFQFFYLRFISVSTLVG
jgi:hypothetical protein